MIDRYVGQILDPQQSGYKKLSSLLTRWGNELGDYMIADTTPARIAEVRDRLRHETTR